MRERLGLELELARGRRVPARPQQHRLPAAGPARRLRHHADRQRRRLVEHRGPAERAPRPRSTATSSRCASRRAPVPSPRSARSRSAPARPPSWQTRRRRSSPASSRARPSTRSSTSPPRARWSAPSWSTAPRPRAAPTRRSRRSSPTSWRRRPRRPTRPAASATPCGRARSWARRVDLEETYQWGLEELARVVAEQEAVAAQIAGPGATVEQAVAAARRRTPRSPCTAPPRCRRGCRRRRTPRSQALDGVHFDIPAPVLHPRVPHRAHAERRHLLHRTQRRLQPPGPHVVVRAAGGHHVQHVAREDDRLPRGRPGPSPADRPGGVPARHAEHVAPAGLLDLRATARAGPCTPSA